MTATGMKNGRIAILIDGLNFLEQGGYRLEGASEIDGLTVTDAALDATGVIATGSNHGVRSEE